MIVQEDKPQESGEEQQGTGESEVRVPEWECDETRMCMRARGGASLVRSNGGFVEAVAFSVYRASSGRFSVPVFGGGSF